MGSKSHFQLSILGLTVAMIAGLAGAFIGGISLFLDGAEPVRIAGLLLGLFIGVGSLLKMIRLNQQEVKDRVDQAENEYHEFMDRWKIEPEQWGRFLEERLKYEQSESKGYGYAAGGVFTFLIALIGFSFFDPLRLILILIGAFLFFFLLGKWGSLFSARRRFEREGALTQSYAHFAERLIILNGKLIMLEDFGVKLRSFELLERFGMRVLSFNVETGFGNRRSNAQYTIPVPEGKEEDSEKLVRHYAGLIN